MKAMEIDDSLSTEIICIIDKSGSMQKIKDDAIGGFNSFLEEQKNYEDDTKITLNLFDSHYKPVYNSLPLNEAQELDNMNYVPSSMTALYDAIGMSINNALKRYEKDPESKPDRVLVVILTDGKENRSMKFDKETIFEMIEERKEDDWEFIFLAANQDAMEEATKMNISTGNAMNFAATSDGMESAYQNMSNTVKSYRMSSRKRSDNLMSDEDVENSADADAESK